MNQKEQMFHDIGIVDFVLTDLTQFLDTHPNNREALEYFNHYSRIKHQMVKDFSRRFFPITRDLAECDREWKWGAAPLPWEGGC